MQLRSSLLAAISVPGMPAGCPAIQFGGLHHDLASGIITKTYVMPASGG